MGGRTSAAQDGDGWRREAAAAAAAAQDRAGKEAQLIGGEEEEGRARARKEELVPGKARRTGTAEMRPE
jgi:hypothetical protein